MPHQQGLHKSVISKELKTCGPWGHPLSEPVLAAAVQPVSVGPRGSTQATATPVLWPGDASLLGNVSPPSFWSLIIRCLLHSSHPVPPSWQVGKGANPRLCWCFAHHYCIQGWGPYSHSSLKQVFSLRHALPLRESSLKLTCPSLSFLTMPAISLYNLAASFLLGDLLREICLSFNGSEHVAVYGPQVRRLGLELQQRRVHRRTVPRSPIWFPFQ